jgi:hypothetical protein
MGMFDTIRSSYDLGPGFSKDLQTKDLECLMYRYWISPVGELFSVDYSYTQSFVDDDQLYQPNGNHGRVTPVYFSGTIRVYPAKWDAYYSPFPECNISFQNGQVIDYGYENKFHHYSTRV